MENKQRLLIVVMSCLLILLGVYSNTMNYANAISVETITFATGVNTRDVSWLTSGSSTTESAYIIGHSGGQAYLFKKNPTSNTIDIQTALNGSSTGINVEVAQFKSEVVSITEAKRYRHTLQNVLIQEVLDGAMSGVHTTIWRDSVDLMYLCHSSGYYKISLSTFSVKTSISFNGTFSSIVSCAIDDTNGFMFLSKTPGDATNSILKVNLASDTWVQTLVVGTGFNPRGIDVDTRDDELWVVGTAEAKVRKYSQALSQLAEVTVDATPRQLTIDDNTNSRRVYVTHEGNTLKIIDIDSQEIKATLSVCDTTSNTLLEDRRLQTVTKVFITCASNVNSIVVDDGVSPLGSTDACIDTNLDGVVDLCFTDTNGDGVPDNGQLGSLGAYRSNANLTQFGSDVFCAFGISAAACTNKDVKTNGVGLTFLVLLIIISYAFLVFIHYQAQTRLAHNNVQVMNAITVHPILLLVMLMIDVGIAWLLDWIQDEIFYTLLIVMLGLAAFGMYRVVKGSGE